MLTKLRYFNLSHLRTLFISEISGVTILLLNYTTVSPQECHPLSFSDQTGACSSLFHLACNVTSLSLSLLSTSFEVTIGFRKRWCIPDCLQS